ncbi:MAG TPA: hypothetical protein VJX92_15725 [Methylomirabilota bacterium]|nr:hypothetical protein [Methylomirabilota bacterium]
MPRAPRQVLLLALVALTLAIWAQRLQGPIDLRWDAGTYYVLGSALAQGRGYRLLNEPGEIAAVQYPPLLPAIVAVSQWILRTDDPITVGHWLRLVFFIMSVVYVVASYTMLGRFVSAGYAFVGVLLCLLHLFGMFLSELLSAELPFALVSVLFMLWRGAPGCRGRPVLAGACATLAYLLRTAGVALLLAWVAESALRREFKRTALRGAIALLPIVGWTAYVAQVQSSASYTRPAYPYQRADYLFYNVTYWASLSLRNPYVPEQGKASLTDLGRRVAGNLTRVPRSLGEAVSADRGSWQSLIAKVPAVGERVRERWGHWVTTAALVFLGGLVLGSSAVQLARPERICALYVFAYICAVCLTPWPLQWQRYWSPLAPFLVLALLQGLLAVQSWAQRVGPEPARAVARMVAAGVICVLLVIQSSTIADAYRTHRGEVILHDRGGEPVWFSLFFYTGPDRELDEALEWLRGRARATDIVATAMPHWAHLVTGLKTVMPPFESDPRKAERLLDAVPVRYLIIDSTDVDIAHLMRRSTAKIVHAGPTGWAPVYTGRSGLVVVYERVTEAPPGPTIDATTPGR